MFVLHKNMHTKAHPPIYNSPIIFIMIFAQQIAAALEIIDKFDESHYALLLAQMQSGKTGTFMLVLCEMIRLNKVEYGVIFSGNRETDLKEQTENQDQFFKDYAQFLRTKGITDIGIVNTIKDTKFQVVWGPDLKHFKPKGKTIYIWEESHYGQTSKQEVDKFIRKVGIDATGKMPTDGSFVLSVSATPFSECADNFNLNQNKQIVRLTPPPQYLSVKKMMEREQICFYKEDPRIKFVKCLQMHNTPGYAIVRGMATLLEPIAIKYGWATIHYDLKSKGSINLDEVMTTRPLVPTVIFIKGMLRMGKQLKKNFVRFVFESSRSTKTDTILQGLLGRCCGYDSRPDIFVYIRQLTATEKVPIFKTDPLTGEVIQLKKRVFVEGKTPRIVPCWASVEVNLTKQDIERFIHLHDSERKTPFRGTNMTAERFIKQVPIKLCLSDEEMEHFKKGKNKIVARREVLRRHLIHDEHQRYVVENCLGIIKVWNADTNQLAKRALSILDKHISDAKPFTDCEGVGVVANEASIFPNLATNTIYITYAKTDIGATTHKEVFYTGCPYLFPPHLQTDSTLLAIKIPNSISSDRDNFIDVISECVDIWRKSRFVSVPNFITPNKCGIVLNDDIFQQIQPGGHIYNEFKKNGITLSCKKMPGRVPHSVSGVRLQKISWDECIMEGIPLIHEDPIATPLGVSLDEPLSAYVIEGIVKGSSF